MCVYSHNLIIFVSQFVFFIHVPCFLMSVLFFFFLFEYMCMRLPLSPWSIAGVSSNWALPGLPYYCEQPVCVPDVIGALVVWWQNNQKKLIKVNKKEMPRKRQQKGQWWLGQMPTALTRSPDTWAQRYHHPMWSPQIRGKHLDMRACHCQQSWWNTVSQTASREHVTLQIVVAFSKVWFRHFEWQWDRSDFLSSVCIETIQNFDETPPHQKI